MAQIFAICSHDPSKKSLSEYNGLLAEIPKIPQAEFDAVLLSLLNAASMPAALK
jgi:hypothetical protein